MDNFLKFAGGAFIVIIVLGFIYGWFETEETNQTTPSVQVQGTVPTATQTDWEIRYKNNFMRECLSEDPSQTAFCECGYNYVFSNYTWDERMELDRMVVEGQTPQALTDLTLYCESTYL